MFLSCQNLQKLAVCDQTPRGSRSKQIYQSLCCKRQRGICQKQMSFCDEKTTSYIWQFMIFSVSNWIENILLKIVECLDNVNIFRDNSRMGSIWVTLMCGWFLLNSKINHCKCFVIMIVTELRILIFHTIRQLLWINLKFSDRN